MARANAAPSEVSSVNSFESSQQVAMVEMSEKNIAKNQDNSKSIAMMEKGSKAMYANNSGACVAMFLFGALVIAGLVTIIVFQAKILHVLQKNGKKK